MDASTDVVLRSFRVRDVNRAQGGEGGQPQATGALDPWQDVGGKTIAPPYNPAFLSRVPEHSSILPQCIDALVTNIEGHGIMFVPTFDPKAADALKAAAEGEKARAQRFFDTASLDFGYGELRARLREDLEKIGYGGWEFILDQRTAELCGLNHIPGRTLRLGAIDKEPTLITRKVLSADGSQWQDQKAFKHLRLYAQTIGGGRTVWFKEPGDPRRINRRTGAVLEGMQEPSDAARNDLARELLWFSRYNANSPYGVPRWIGTLIAIAGSRASEDVNLNFFRDRFPPILVTIAGGVFTQKQEEHFQEKLAEAQGVENFWKVLVMSAVNGSTGSVAELAGPGKQLQPRIQVERLELNQSGDALFQTFDANNRNKVRSACGIPALFTGESQDYTRACYSEDTETLTESGWKLWHEVGQEERVAAFDPNTQRIAFVRPSELHVYDYEGEMVHFSSSSVDILVTPDHKMIYRFGLKRGWKEATAEKIEGFKRVEFHATTRAWEGRDLGDVVLPKLCQIERGHGHSAIVADDWLEFLGYYLSEGNINHSPKSGHHAYYVMLSQKKPLVLHRMLDCLDRIGWAYSTRVGADGVERISISNKCLREWLAAHTGGKAKTKHLPSGYTHLSKRQLRILFDALMDGDGSYDTRPNRTSCAYYSSSYRLAGEVQEIALKLGYRATIREGQRCWRVLMCEQTTTVVNASTRVPYKGKVYCFSVPDFGYFVTRRNGRVAFQGNTARESMAAAERGTFSPARGMVDDRVNRHIMSRLEILYWRYKGNGPQMTHLEDVVSAVDSMTAAGAGSSNIAAKVIGEALGVDIPQSEQAWANLPTEFVKLMLQSGVVTIDPESGEASANGTEETRERFAASVRHAVDQVIDHVVDSARRLDEAERQAG